MEAYTGICISRILEIPEYDHIIFDFVGLDVWLDDVGIDLAREILYGYIAKEKIDAYQILFEAENKSRKAVNDIILLNRKTGKKDLLQMMKNKGLSGIDADVVILIKEELKSRRILNRVFCFISSKLDTVRFNVKFSKQIKLLEIFAKKEKEKSSCY